ncbi:MAG: DHA2 family efflux MFS transporter permease subunit [Bacillus sp. (in: firmicutes)]
MKSQRLSIMILYVVSMFMVSMDGTIVNVILPTIAMGFDVSVAETNGVNIAYLVSIAICLPTAGYLSNRFGVKRVLLIAIAGFTLASFFCGIATSLQGLIAARILQGLAGGLITPVSMTLLFRTFPPVERQKLSRSLVLPIAFAPAIGPLVGGLFAEYFSWRWAFFINVPFGVAIIILGICLVKEFEVFNSPFDVKGYILVAIGLPFLMVSLSELAAEGFTWKVVCFGVVGISSLWVFYRHEYKITDPLLEMRLYEDRLFRSLSFVAMCSMGALMGMLYLFPLMYQNTYSASALESSLITFTEALGLMVASRLLPLTANRFGMKAAIQGGMLGTIVVFISIIALGPSANPWILRLLMFCIGICLGHTVVGSQVSAFNHVNKMDMGKATTLYNMLNRVGAAAGIAIVATILSIMTKDSGIMVITYQIALLGTVLFLIIGLFFTLFVKSEQLMMNGKKA